MREYQAEFLPSHFPEGSKKSYVHVLAHGLVFCSNSVVLLSFLVNCEGCILPRNLEQAMKALFITGAGISVSAGLHTYRGQKGLYRLAREYSIHSAKRLGGGESASRPKAC